MQFILFILYYACSIHFFNQFCIEFDICLIKVMVRRWNPETEDITNEGISHVTTERISSGN